MRRWMGWLAIGIAAFLAGAAVASLATEWVIFPFVRHMTDMERLSPRPLPHISVAPLIGAFLIELAGFIGMVVTAEMQRSGRLSARWLRDKRRYVAVVIITAAAVLTPPDVVSQLMLAIPAYLAFEALIAWVALGESRQG